MLIFGDRSNNSDNNNTNNNNNNDNNNNNKRAKISDSGIPLWSPFFISININERSICERGGRERGGGGDEMRRDEMNDL